MVQGINESTHNKSPARYLSDVGSFPYTTGTLGTPTATINYVYGDNNWKDKLTSYNGLGITYDAIGNPLTYNGKTYTWERGNELAGISGGGLTASYKYNSDGIRTVKTVNGVVTKYHLVGDKVTYESNGNDTLYYSYDPNGNLVSMNLNGTEYFYVRNAQGDIIKIVNASGTVVVSYVYDTWGKMISTTGTLASTVGVKNPYRYRGYRYDSETGLYYLQSRYYNPEWGRFINADSLAGKQGVLLSHNVFAYCKNDPVNNVDPDGNNPLIQGGINLLSRIGPALSNLACRFGNLVRRIGPRSEAPIKVIGHYPEYILKAEELGTKPFSIPSNIWDKMTEAERWAANQKFLDRAIAEGSEFILATPIDQVRAGTYLEKEIEYLVSQGYRFSDNLTRLIK